MSLELHHALLVRAFEERLVERLVAQLEWDVHPRTILFARDASIERRLIEIVVKKRGLGDVHALNRGNAALREKPLEDQSRNIDRVGRRRVDHRFGFGLRLPMKSRWRDGQRAVEQVVANDDERQTRRTGVLL